MSVADAVVWLSVAVRVTVCALVTASVAMAKSAEFLANGTATTAGGRTLSLSLVSRMLTPPGGALPLSVTVPVRFFPPRIDPAEVDSAASCTEFAGSI